MPANLVITNARVYTADPAMPWASSIAIRNGQLLCVGTDDESLAAADGSTVVRDAGGAFLMPGLIDVHNHHSLAGRSDLFELSIPVGSGVDEILDAVRDYAATLPAGSWIIGGPWGSNLLSQINSADALGRLDAASAGHPVMLMEDSRHNRWVNTRALELAGLPTAAATGVLLESGGLPVEEAIATTNALTAEQHRRASQRGIEILASFGVTGFQDAAASLEILQSLKALDDAGELQAWVVTCLTVNDPIFGFEVVGEELMARAEEFRTEHHRPDFVKVFLDGVPPARTGAFLEPYLADEEHGAHFSGTTTLSPDELMGWLRAAASRGLSAKIHCSGDAAVRLVLDTVEQLRADGFSAPRYQIAHGQFVHADDIARFAELGVAADISPFIWFPGPIPEAIRTALPEDRAERMQPNRLLLDSGALVAGGSDWPVSESPNAWEGIEGLVTRADPSGVFPGTLWPEQAITLPEAIAVFTSNAAEAMGLGAVTGSLRPGKSADFIMLDRNPFELPSEQLSDITVTETWFAGRQVFDRNAG